MCLLVCQHRKAGLVIPLNELPQRQTILKVLVFQDRVGTDHGRTDIVLAHFLHEGRGKIRGDRLVDAADAIHGRGKLRVKISIGLVFYTIER